MGCMQIISILKLYYEKQQMNLVWKSLDCFQKQTKDEDKRPDRWAVLVNTRDKAGDHPAYGMSGDWKITPNCQIESRTNKPYYEVKDLNSAS